MFNLKSSSKDERLKTIQRELLRREFEARGLDLDEILNPKFVDTRRSSQIQPEGDWRTWLFMAGRGAGKTFSGANWCHDRVQHEESKRLVIAAPTASDVRDIIVDGVSGLIETAHKRNIDVQYEPSKRRLSWVDYKATAILFSADEPERARGLQGDTLWFDEIGAARRANEAWTQLMLGLRLGDNPRALATTTPRPTELIKRLLKLPSTVVTRGKTTDNKDNLADSFLEEVYNQYGGTRLGRQELDGELLEDVVGALWQFAMFERPDFRIESPPQLKRIVVAVDPNASNNENSDEMGVIVCGETMEGTFIVLEDRTLKASPEARAKAVVDTYHRWRADLVVLEVNNGGDWIPALINSVDKSVACKSVHASRGKLTRAEPISILYEQGKVQHLGVLGQLEDELLQWTPGVKSPNRLDALVWGLTELNAGKKANNLFLLFG